MINVEQVKMAMAASPVPSLSIPFNKDGSIDYEGLRKLIDFTIEGGSELVLLTYGDSLFSILTDTEIAEVTRAVVDHTMKRALVVAATGMWWTGECVKFAKFARSAGADILMSLPPNWAGSYSVNTLKQHYRSISNEIPVMIVTSLMDTALPLQVLSELLDEDNSIVAIKDDICGSYGRKMASVINGKWAILSGGCKENHLDIMPYGVDGYLSMYKRFKPEVSQNYWNAIRKNDIKTAVDIINRFEIPFFEELTIKTELDSDALIHASMEIFDVCGRWRRPPYKNADEKQMNIIKEFFRERSLY